MSRRVRVGVLAGGASTEREISLATGIEIALNDRDFLRYRRLAGAGLFGNGGHDISFVGMP